jgi:hypothetical protein
MATNRKVRKFGDGGMLQDISVDESIDKKPDVAITRGDAFKAARKAGKKTFPYGGKEYTTETAEEKAKRTPKVDATAKYQSEYKQAKEQSDKRKVQNANDTAKAGMRANAYSAQLARESDARSNPYGTPSMYKKGGKVKKYAAGGDIAPMSAMPSGKQLKENIEAQKKSEAERQARLKDVKATVKKYARGGGIESKGKTRGKIF